LTSIKFVHGFGRNNLINITLTHLLPHWWPNV